MVYLPSATKLRRLCFYRCVSVHKGGGIPACLAGGIPACLATGLRGVCSQWSLVPGVPAQGGLVPGVPAPGGCLLRGCGDPPESRQLLLRTVRILLECILVHLCKSSPYRKQTLLKTWPRPRIKTVSFTDVSRKLKLDADCSAGNNLCGSGAECGGDTTCTCLQDYIADADGINCKWVPSSLTKQSENSNSWFHLNRKSNYNQEQRYT